MGVAGHRIDEGAALQIRVIQSRFNEIDRRGEIP
jgi:hypothetical protein